MLKRFPSACLRGSWTCGTSAALSSASGFKMGKLPPGELRSRVLRHLGCSLDSVVVGPAVGEDSAVLRVGAPLICAKSDPITGASARAGSLLVHVNANDIAASGGTPQWLLVTALYPVGTHIEAVESVSRDVDATCRELGIAVVGGHTEVTPAVTQQVLCGAMVGSLRTVNPIRTSGAQVGDRLILTKGAALEATAVLCSDKASQLVKRGVFKNEQECSSEGDACWAQVSVVRDAAVALDSVPEGAITSMHDPTEGGVAGALHEVADAAGKGFVIDRSAVGLRASSARIAAACKVDPLQLISSGALLLCVRPQFCDSVLRGLRSKGIAANDIGHIVADTKERLLRDGGKVAPLVRPDQDALWTALEELQ